MPTASSGRSLLPRVVWLLWDVLIWALAVYFATWLRLEYRFDETLVSSTAITAGATAAAFALVGLALGVYSRNKIRASFDEVQALAGASLITTLGLGVVAFMTRPVLVPRSVPLIAGLMALALLLASRMVIRSLRERLVASRTEGKEPIIVFGAGNAGRLLVSNLLHDPDSPYRPVAILDDDASKRRMRIHGVKVRGNRYNIESVSQSTGAIQLVIAIANPPRGLVADIRQKSELAGVRALVVPPLSRVLGTGLTAQDIREVKVEDLLGRTPVRLDEASIAEQINHRVVLVTGAGGSIGSELCRQLSLFNPSKIVLLDRDESAMHAVALDLVGDGLFEDRNVALADIRDLEALRAIFSEHKPQIVFHTAALKHLPLLESYPLEAWKTNVVGTANVLKAASENGVEVFVNISTDKAADPCCNLGYSKRLGERLTASYARHEKGRYLSVRFGNVLGSRGSVVPAFTAQIAQGGPVTVTHKDVKRFFMLIPEACQLVMQAAVIGHDGEVMVLDMGEQVKIIDLAKALISMSGRTDVEISFTGLRPGEKMAEDLFFNVDESRVTEHPLVSAVGVPPLDPAQVMMPIPAPAVAVELMRDYSVEVPEDSVPTPVGLRVIHSPKQQRPLRNQNGQVEISEDSSVTRTS